MRQPKSERHAKKILKMAVDSSPDKVIRITEILRESVASSPYGLPSEHRAIALEAAISEGFGDIEAEKLIRGASQVMNLLDSGYKLFQSDAVLDALVKEAQNHLYKPVRTRDGDEIGIEFNTEVMNAIVKAVNTKMNTLVKVQSNLIQAQRTSQMENDNNHIDISSLEREQLERFVSGEIMDHQEILELVNRKHEVDILPSFDGEIIDNGN